MTLEKENGMMPLASLVCHAESLSLLVALPGHGLREWSSQAKLLQTCKNERRQQQQPQGALVEVSARTFGVKTVVFKN